MPDPFENPEELLRRVYAYVAYRIGDGPRAEDVTSEAIERALRYRDSYKPSLGSPAAWLIGIARRCLLDETISLGRERHLPPEPAWDDPGDTSETRLDLARALEALDDRERELVALRYGADLRAREIAELLFLRTNTVEVALHRALAKLRVELDVGAELPARRQGRRTS
jgi:RNA polymerase sigma-70 factor (ECF subfamily)